MKCESRGCSNEARYLTAGGEELCSLCDMGSSHASTKMTNLPEILRRVSEIIILVGYNHDDPDIVGLRALITYKGVARP